MLENIKSPFIIKKIFSHFHDNIELELIKYNKEFQNALNIDINNYKIFREISIILESDNKGKEYDNYNNKVIFEGEYKNLKRNGKGKEFGFDGNIKFEGEYLNGRRWNGKEDDKNNKIMFEIKNGNGQVKDIMIFILN